MLKDKVLLYHKNCPDGYGSRYCFEKKYRDEMSYIPVSHGKPPPEGLDDKEIWIADFSYSRDILLNLKDRNKSITVIDHHKTAEANLKGLDFCHFDMSHCGAVLSWHYCNGINKPPPILLRYVEDQDLWKWNLPFAKEILSVVDSYDYSFRLWDDLSNRLADDDKFALILEEGSALLRQKNRNVIRIANNTHTLNILGKEVPAVCSPIYQSELAEHITVAADADYGVTYYFDGTGYVFSIRGRETKDIDVSNIAVQFGGGGHRFASGFKVTTLQELSGGTTKPKRVRRVKTKDI